VTAEIPDLGHDLRVLTEVLEMWASRDDSKAQPGVRQSAKTAVDAIDRMLATLHQVRAELCDEIRSSDDATNLRVDALLARIRAERAERES
jgi:hypothetical protein